MGKYIEFVIPYPSSKAERTRWSKNFGLNAIYAGKHWKARRADSQYWHALVRAQMHRQDIPMEVFRHPVCVTFGWNDHLDIDNHAYMGKMIVDAMKEYCLADDSRKYVVGIKHEFHNRDCITVRVEEVAG